MTTLPKPPRGYYHASPSLITAKIGDAAFRLWHLLTLGSWGEIGCGLTKEELADWTGCSERKIDYLLAELTEAGFLSVTRTSGKQRLLRAVNPDVDSIVDKSVDNLPARKNTSSPRKKKISRLAQEEEEESKSVDLPPPNLLTSRKGGVGGNQKKPAAPAKDFAQQTTEADKIVILLRQHEIRQRPAEQIAERAEREGVSLTTLKAVLEHQLRETGNNIGLTVWRLQNDPLVLPEAAKPHKSRLYQEFRDALE